MSYRIYKFGTTTLPSARLAGTFGTGPSAETAVAAVGGMHDTHGNGYASLRLPHEIVYSCWIRDTAANTQTALKAWQALRGVRAKLYRVNEFDDSEHWCYARLMQVRAPWQYQRKTMQPLELLFYVMTPWYEDASGATWYLDAGEYLDDGLFLDSSGAVEITLTDALTVTQVTSGGNAPTRYIWAVVTAATSPITSITILLDNGSTVCCLVWTGTLAVGKLLVIDGRSQAVTNDGAPDTGTLTVNTTVHTSNHWLELAPTALNGVTITRVGGGATSKLELHYNYCWS